MISRIVFIVNSAFCERDYKRFGIELLEKNGFRVEVWDLSRAIHPEVYAKVSPPDSADFSLHRAFRSRGEASRAISGELGSSDFVVMMFGYYPKSFFVFKAISKAKADYAVITALAIPAADQKTSRTKRLLEKLTLKNILSKFKTLVSLDFILRRIPFKWLGIKPARYNLAGGAKSPSAYKYTTNDKTETLWLHALDYDLYLDEMGVDPDAYSEKYIVFLDEYQPFHPDYMHKGIASPVTPERYYPVLCSFFEFIEGKTGMKVVIAAHPRSHYDKMPDYYGGRRVLRGHTVKLVKHADIVLTHSSTSLSFAVLFKKPLIFIVTSEVYEYQKEIIQGMSSLLDKNPIRIDRPYQDAFDLNKETVINESSYLNYKNDYIKKGGSPEGKFWQLFTDRLKKTELQVRK